MRNREILQAQAFDASVDAIGSAIWKAFLEGRGFNPSVSAPIQQGFGRRSHKRVVPLQGPRSLVITPVFRERWLLP